MSGRSPGAAGVHHVAIRVGDVAKVSAFYRGVMGLARLRTQREGKTVRSIWLAAGSTIVMIERRASSEALPDARSLDATIFAIDVGDRSRIVKRLRRRGVPIEGETAFSLYFRDPEGRRIGVSHYPFNPGHDPGQHDGPTPSGAEPRGRRSS